MAKFKFVGLDKYVSQLNKLQKDTTPALKAAVYDGTAIVLKAMKEEIEAIQVFGEEQLTHYQKQGLLKGLGVASIKLENGVVNTKIGFDGYNEMKTKKYPNGQPNAMIARSIVKGTAFRKKNDFVRRAMRKSQEQAEKVMSIKIEEKIYAITKGDK